MFSYPSCNMAKNGRVPYLEGIEVWDVGFSVSPIAGYLSYLEGIGVVPAMIFCIALAQVPSLP